MTDKRTWSLLVWLHTDHSSDDSDPVESDKTVVKQSACLHVWQCQAEMESICAAPALAPHLVLDPPWLMFWTIYIITLAVLPPVVLTLTDLHCVYREKINNNGTQVLASIIVLTELQLHSTTVSAGWAGRKISFWFVTITSMTFLHFSSCQDTVSCCSLTIINTTSQCWLLSESLPANIDWDQHTPAVSENQVVDEWGKSSLL